MERLQKVIANRGFCSRRKAEELILEGRVRVNGEIIDTLGYKVSGNDEIRIDNKPLETDEKVVYLLNKPKNIISSASDEKGRKTVVDLIDSDVRIYPLGRLDFDSSGLILLSNDGDLMQKITHPSKQIEKEYEVTIDGLIKKEQIEKLKKGVAIDNYISAPCEIKVVGQNTNNYTTRLIVIIHEGKNREIRKMFKTQGFNVTRLHRIRIANLNLGNLKSGEYRLLKPFEIKKLKKYLDEFDL